MKQAIHPQYHTIAKVRCSTCGTEYEFGSTEETLQVAICAKCHPFYTGEQQVVVDSANKISSFKAKLDKVEELRKRKAEIDANRAEREKNKVGVIGEKKMTLRDLIKAKSEKK